MGTTKTQPDTRPAQAERVADYLEQHPDSTAKEIDAAVDAGCMSKVLSDMPRMGYGVRTYTLTHRPTTQPDLFAPL